jgi:site-specific DNA-methyltransferase (adenine-specific)
MDFADIVKGINIKPYYLDDSVVIYNCDNRDVLPMIPDKSIDLIITDPPYGIDYQSCRRTECQRKDKIVGDNEFPLWFFDAVKPDKAYFIFCRWDILSQLPKPKSFIVWDKCVHSMGNLEHEFGRQWEAIAFYPQDNHEFIYRPVDVIRVMRIASGKLIHPNEKPVDVITPIIASNKGDIVLDMFMGGVQP